MSKRFTETEKWKKAWFRALEPKYKLLWFYLLDNCDQHGIWLIDMELASFQIGINFCEKDLDAFGGRIEVIADKVIIDSFLAYQYGNKSKNHKTIANGNNRIEELRAFADERKNCPFDDVDERGGTEGVPKGYRGGTEEVPRRTGKGKGKGTSKGTGTSNIEKPKDVYAEHCKNSSELLKTTETIIEFINYIGDKNFSPRNFTTQKLIKNILDLGYTKDDIIKVINTKGMNWPDQKNNNGEPMMNFFTPKTLLNPDKFEMYLNETPKE